MCDHENREAAMVVVRRDAAGKPTVWCDPCIEPIVHALNNGGLPTVASCCGHGDRPGNVALADGRELVIMPDFAAARVLDAALHPAPSEAPSVTPHEFDEDVNDASMCTCGIPVLDHDRIVPAPREAP